MRETHCKRGVMSPTGLNRGTRPWTCVSWFLSWFQNRYTLNIYILNSCLVLNLTLRNDHQQFILNIEIRAEGDTMSELIYDTFNLLLWNDSAVISNYSCASVTQQPSVLKYGNHLSNIMHQDTNGPSYRSSPKGALNCSTTTRHYTLAVTALCLAERKHSPSLTVKHP